MSEKKSLIHLISSLEKHEFDKVVKEYIKEEYDFDKVIITDGKNDTGLDIRVFDFEGMKLQFQLTVQKSKTSAERNGFEKKLVDDLRKAQINFREHGYSNKLIFFYSYEVTQERIRNYRRLALKDYKIDLDFIDANRLAQEAENILDIQRILYRFSGLDKFNVKESNFQNEKENLIFDMLSFGKPSEFKLKVIEAFVLKSIFINDSLSKEEIIGLCENKFGVQENQVFYEKLLNRLQTNRSVRKSYDKSNYLLSEDYKKVLNDKVKQYEFEEQYFLSKISKILEKYNHAEYLEEYLSQLKSLYIKNFNSDLKSLLEENSSTDSVKILIRDFIDFIEKKDKTKEESETIAIELLEFCLKDKFIQKIAASGVYFKNINNSRLQNYLTTQKKIFIDASLAIHAICYYYSSHKGYDNSYYKMTANLIDFFSKEGISLHIAERYIWEVESHVRDAIYLLPYTRIDGFEQLGTSKNVFYNFYLHLKETEKLDTETTFSSFLAEYGFKENYSSRSNSSIITHHLKEMNIHVEQFESEYNIDDVVKIFEEKLLANGKYKTNFAKVNDSVMLRFLSDNDVDVHPLKPVFVTWDKTFFQVQEQYMKEFPDSQNWLMLQPSRLIDSYALLKFSIDSETVTENLLGLMSDDLVQNTQTLIDTIKTILELNDKVGLKYANELKNIRQQEINDINSKIIIPPDSLKGQVAIDDIFINLSRHFENINNADDFRFFKKIFTKPEYMDDVISNIKQAINDYYENQFDGEKIYGFFESLVSVLKATDNANKGS